MRNATLKCPRLRKPTSAVLRRVQKLGRKHPGKIAAIEPDSGEHFLGDSVIDAAKKGREKFPKAAFYFVRLGYPAVDFESGGLQKA